MLKALHDAWCSALTGSYGVLSAQRGYLEIDAVLKISSASKSIDKHQTVTENQARSESLPQHRERHRDLSL